MATVTKTELNQQTAKVLARVAAGERLTVTERSRPIAEITPPTRTAWEKLVAAGRVTMPTASGALRIRPAKSERSSTDILRELRDDRR